MTDQPFDAHDAVRPEDLQLVLSDFQLLRQQVNDGRISRPFLTQQIETAIELFTRLAAERRSANNRDRSETLASVSRLISSSLDLQTVLDQTMDALIQLTGAERGFLMLRNDDGELSVHAARNLDQMTLESESFQYSRSIAHQVLDTGQPIVTTNAQEDERFSNRASILAQSLRGIMATPLRSRGHVLGVAYVDSRGLTGLFDESNLSVMEALAAQATIAIENARLFNQTDQQLAQRVDELQELRRIDLLFSQTTSVDDALRLAAECVCHVARATGGMAGLVESSSAAAFTRTQTYGDMHGEAWDAYPRAFDAVRTGEASLFAHGDHHAVLALPLGRESRLLGAVLARRASVLFTEAEQELAERIAKRAAITIENLLLVEENQNLALATERERVKILADFIRDASHDLRTPLSTVNTSLYLLQRLNSPDEQSHHLQVIEQQVSHLSRLIEGLLTMTRLDSEAVFSFRPVDVNHLMRDLEIRARQISKPKGHTIHITLDPALQPIRADERELYQAVEHVLENAVQFTPDFGAIYLQTRVDSNHAIIEVRDTGIGIHENDVPRIFERFYRADKARSANSGGLGLGLPIARKIIEAHRGTIDVHSLPNVGTTVILRLPRE